MIYWFTGQPGHGKTILADKLAKYLDNTLPHKIFRVDGDDLRNITINKDYSKEGRIQNVKSAQDISLYLHNQGLTVVVSLVSPYIQQREDFKQFVGSGIVEYFVHTTDIRGRESYHVSEYQSPVNNFISINTTGESPDESFLKVLNGVKDYE